MSLKISGGELQRLLPETLENTVRSWLARSAGALLVFAAALSWLGLFTWSIGDPSLTHTTAEPVRNLLGPFGAVISDLLLQTLGLAAVFALLGPLVWGMELLGARLVPSLRTKLVLFPIAVLALAGGCSGLPTLPSWPLGNGFGGLLGDLMFNMSATALAAISPERSGALAGLALLAGGLGLLAQSVGLSTRDLAALVLRDNAPRAADPRSARWPDFRSAFGRAGRIEPELPIQDRAASSPGPAAAAAVPGLAESPFARQAEQDLCELSGDDPSGRGGEFDVATEADVRAVAERFAPTSRPTSRGGGAPRPASGLFGAFALDRSGSADRRPSLNLLRRPASARPAPELTQTTLRGNARLLEDVLADFGIKGEVKDIRPGPVVTLYELEPARGIKSSRIIGLADDIARSMSATAVRVAVVPGRNAIGIELPNVRRETVYLREIFESEPFRSSPATLPIALGKSIGGEAIVADLARMPHLLVAGTTGSGKSVGVNAMILSLLYKLAPTQCRLLMIDPKMLELSVYNDIPHLLTPVVTDPAQAVAALNWAVGEMEERYKRMAKLGARSIDAFNNRVHHAGRRGEALHRTVHTGFDPRTGAAIYEREQLELEPMPYIVVIVDEFADLMIVAGKEIEAAVQRLAQMARAAGIHLVMATQRPSVDIVTGTIKANFPTRISFKVASRIDSRTILNEQGAEQLLGQGDMLFSGGSGQVLRVHGAFVSDGEVEAVVRALREAGEPNYVAGITDVPANVMRDRPESVDVGDDLYARAVAIVLGDRKASTSYLQRRLGIGYNRAADLIERMERDGLIGAANSVGRREILAGPGAGAH